MNTVTDSFVYRCVSASATGRWWRSSSNLEGVLTGSRLLQTVPRSFWLGLTVVIVGQSATLLALDIRFLLWFFLTVVTALAYFAPVGACLALPAAMVWSPKIPFGSTGAETIYVTPYHSLLFGAIAALLFRPAYKPKDSEAYVPLLFMLTAAAISIVAGVARGTLLAPALGLVYLAQLTALAAIFGLAYSLGNRMGRAGVYAWMTAVVTAAAYGVTESRLPYESLPGAYRTFERGYFEGQANHFAGLFVVGTCVGLALLSEKRWRSLGAACAVLSVAALVGTGSREGLVALGAALMVFYAVKYPKPVAPLILFGLICAAMGGPVVWHELTVPGSSLFDRLVAWKSALSTTDDYPLFGIGLGARHRSFYDNHYILMLAETGVAGVIATIVWLAWLIRALRHGARSDGVKSALCLGAMAGLAGVAVQGLAAIVFLITVIAGPMYWLAGYALGMERSGAQ